MPITPIGQEAPIRQIVGGEFQNSRDLITYKVREAHSSDFLDPIDGREFHSVLWH